MIVSPVNRIGSQKGRLSVRGSFVVTDPAIRAAIAAMTIATMKMAKITFGILVLHEAIIRF
jgi:hypothetical protein